MTVTDDPKLDGGDVSAADFRNAIGHFATGVTVITSVDADRPARRHHGQRGHLALA